MAGQSPLNPRSLLFTLYGDYVHPLGQSEVYVGALVRAAEEFGVTGNALRSALSRMTREGWLAARRAERPRYRLTQRGLALIEEGTARIYGRLRPEWDGRWLLVSYSLPERRRGQRDRLRQGLTFLGFGSLGNGIFVSPHDLRSEVRDLVVRAAAEADVTVHHGSLEWPRDAAGLVARAWDLAEVERRYRDFVAQERRRAADESRLSDRDAFRRRFMLTHEFRRFSFVDPDLPARLLPRRWAGGEAQDLFLRANAALRRRAEAHWLLIAGDATIVDNDERTKRGGDGSS